MLESFKMQYDESSIESVVKSNILKYIMLNGTCMVPQIADITGYSLTTVAKYTNEMLRDNIILEVEKINLHVKGRRTVKYSVNEDFCYFLGVHVMNFELHLALINFTGKVLKMEHHMDFQFENNHTTLENICDATQNFISKLTNIDTSKILNINMNLPGRVNARKGTSATMFNFEETQHTPLVELLSERFERNVSIENDTKAMAYGEYISYFKDKYKDILYVNVSWGIGIGIIINGQLYYGKDGYSGEFGHIHKYDNNIMCHCGKKGCLETEVSVNAIHRKLVKRIMAGESSVLADKVKRGGIVSSFDIIEAAENEDPLCIDLISQTATELGHQLAGMINLFNPEAIIIGGTLSKAEPYYFLQPLEVAVRKFSLKLMCQDVPITTSLLAENAGVIGACMIGRSRVFSFL